MLPAAPLLASAPLLQLACAVCMGDPASPQGHAMRLAILLLLAIIVSVLVSIALVARKWAARARELDAAEGALADRASQPAALALG